MKSIRFFFSIAALSIATAAVAHEAHVHGVGKLDVALDGSTLSLHLDSPLINLLGFEHAATSAPDRQAAQKMGVQLRAADQVFVTTPAAQCHATAVTLMSAALDPALLGQKPAAADANKKAADHDGHADLDADFVFSCAHPEQLRAIDVKLFDLYPGFHRIDVQAVTPKGQSAATLAPGSSMVAL
ncbi:DUF2796 domain-containing protein [Oxalobacteraceae bacterium CAVE-383]|nr:DUF2796 domain-containing protein [Oxalobacteraceae bacterium CAVE-383]